MSALPWFRMYSEFATDPKVQMLSEADQRRFIMLLCLRCGNGDVTLHDDEIAFQLRISNDEWAATKAVLVSKGLIDDESSPIAWDKRQYVSDSSAARVRAHRERKKKAVKQECNVTVTPPDTDTDTDTDIDIRAKSSATSKNVTQPVTPPATAQDPESIDQRQKYAMNLDWQPDDRTIEAMCRQSGVDSSSITDGMLIEYRLWYSGKQSHASNHEWHTRLVKWAIRERATAHEKPSGTSSPARSNAPDFHSNSTDWADGLEVMV